MRAVDTCEKPNMGVCVCMAARMAERGPSAPAKTLCVRECASCALQAVNDTRTKGGICTDAVRALPFNELACLQQVSSSCRQPPTSAMPTTPMASACQIMPGLQTLGQVSRGPVLTRLLTRPAELSTALRAMTSACQWRMPCASAPIRRSAGGDFLMKTADEATWSAGLLRSCRKLAP